MPKLNINAEIFEHNNIDYTSVGGDRWFKYIGTLFKGDHESLSALALLRSKGVNHELISSALNLMVEVDKFFAMESTDGDLPDN